MGTYRFVTEFVKARPDWRDHLTKRFHKFVEEHEKNDGNLSEVATRFDYTLVDMESIFTRIEAEAEEKLKLMSIYIDTPK